MNALINVPEMLEMLQAFLVLAIFAAPFVFIPTTHPQHDNKKEGEDGK